MIMASLAHHLSPLLFMNFLYTFINGNFAQPPNTVCPSFECGNGIIISYPFWHQNQQFEYCGYPGFNLSCNDQNTILQLSNDLYHVKKINYHDNYLTLVYADLKEATCPKIRNDVTLTANSLFNYTLGNKMLRFFYNCNLYPPSLVDIACLQHGVKRSYVFMAGAIPEFDWQKYCESIVTTPVIDKEANGELDKIFGEALQDGFKLTWLEPDGACQSCEATGGFCGHRNYLHKNFFCVCSDGSQHLVNCHDEGAVSIQFEPNYVAIGALIFGCLIIAATVFYFIQKKRVALYKPISHRIQSNGKKDTLFH